QDQEFECDNHNSETPVDGLTVFTDAGKKNRRAAITWQENGIWREQVLNGSRDDSLQTLELAAVIWALTNWSHVPINIVSDSLYVVGIVKHIECSLIREVGNKRLYELLI
ncbi:POK19 protein, partial [Jacana jacana]|nr:POK19 protein [Jacana jacana]